MSQCVGGALARKFCKSRRQMQCGGEGAAFTSRFVFRHHAIKLFMLDFYLQNMFMADL